MFERDINITKRLKGTGIAPEFEGAWICENIGFLVMERLSRSADHFVKYEEEERIEIPEWVVKEMKRVLAELSEKIVHGDIKPDNFLYKGKRLYIYLISEHLSTILVNLLTKSEIWDGVGLVMVVKHKRVCDLV